MRDNDFIKKSGYLPDAGALTQELMTKVAGADLGEGCRGWFCSLILSDID